MLKLPVKYPIVDENIDLSEYAKKSDVDAIDASLDNKAEKKDVEKISSQLDNKANQSDLETERNRINNIIVNNNPTEGNSELIDARAGIEGSSHGSVGNHIRNIENGFIKNITQECFSESIYNNISKRIKKVNGTSTTYSSQTHCTVACTLLNSKYNFGVINSVKCNVEFESLSSNIKSVQTKVQVNTLKTGVSRINTVGSFADIFNFDGESGNITLYTWVECVESGVLTNYKINKLELVINDTKVIDVLKDNHSFVFGASGTINSENIFLPAISTIEDVGKILGVTKDLLTSQNEYDLKDSKYIHITSPFNLGNEWGGFAVKEKNVSSMNILNNIEIEVDFYTFDVIEKFSVLFEYVENGETKTVKLGEILPKTVVLNKFNKSVSLNSNNVTRVKVYCRFENSNNKQYSFVIGNLKLKIDGVDFEGLGSWYTTFSSGSINNIETIPNRVEFNELKDSIGSNGLYGKSIKVFGDSIFDTSNNPLATPAIVAEMTGMTQHNYAVASSGYINDAIYNSPTWGTTNTNVTKMIERSIDDGITPDYVLVGAGTNDWDFQRKPLGTIDNAIVSSPTLDTFYGAVGLTIRMLHKHYPFAKYLFVTPIPRNQPTGSGNQHTAKGNGVKLTDYAKAIREVCEYFSIPYLDGISKCNFHLENDLAKAKYMPDGLHPSEEGARKIYAPLIINALNSI